MFDSIDPRKPTPLYAQIAASVRVAVATGALAPGTALPSVRALANQLRVNPATVVQAYRELSLEGFVEKRHGAGTFVLDVAPEVRRQEREIVARSIARRALGEAARAGVSAEALRAALETELSASHFSPISSEETRAVIPVVKCSKCTSNP